MKCVALFSAVLLAVSGVFAQTTAPTTRPACIDLNFTDPKQVTKINSLNSVIDLAIESGLLANGLAQVDPLNITNQKLSPQPFSLLDVNFTLTPTIKQLKVTGLSKIVPEHLNITGPTGLNVSAWINGTIDISAQFSLEIAQLNHQWWQVCWPNILQPTRCPPKVVDMNVDLSLAKADVLASVLIPMKGCAAGLKPAVCKDISVTELLVAANSQDFSTVLPRILHRLISVSLADFELTFDHMNNISFQFAKADPLLMAIGEKLYDFSEMNINKHRLSYKIFTEVVDALVKDLVNQMLKTQFQPLLGATCYDS